MHIKCIYENKKQKQKKQEKVKMIRLAKYEGNKLHVKNT